MESYFRYWGKAEKDGERYHLLPFHCLDVAAVGHSLLWSNAMMRQRFTAVTGLDEPVCCKWLILLLALHDIGKFSESFQNLRPDLLEQLQSITSRKQYQARHDSLGNLYLKNAMEKEELSLPPGVSFYEWQDVVLSMLRPFAGHHGVPPKMQGDNGLPLRLAQYFSENDIVAARQLAETVIVLMCGEEREWPLPSPEELEAKMKKASWLMAGFVVLCDWIGSNNRWFPFHSDEMTLDEYWRNHALPQAEKALREAGINAGIPLAELSGFSGLFPHIASPTPLQAFVEACPVGNSPQLFILEDVTGSGKTEAALLLAGRLLAAGSGQGIFVALPTMATSNAMYNRLAKPPNRNAPPLYLRLFENNSNPSIVLAHGARHLSETFMASVTGSNTEASGEEAASAQCSSWLADNRKKALLADVGVGTLDQALLAILPARFQSLRLFGLARHILVIDEVHAYDPYMNKLLQNLLAFHSALGGSAILLSATLPTHIRRDFISAFARGCGDRSRPQLQTKAYPLATAYSVADGVRETAVDAMLQRTCTVAVQLVPDVDEVVKRIEEAANQGKCVCWIRNTVHDALTAFDCLSNLVSVDDLLLFHARFVMGDRLDIEEAVTNIFGKKSTAGDRCGKVLIATQVVEQSLDLDFDLLITDLAPMDLLIQRAGRLHRHPRDEEGNPLKIGADRRGPPCMIIHGPLPDEDAGGNWYKSAFPKASFVYPWHGRLWLTARLLEKYIELKMPDHARELIEAAFSVTPGIRIPEPLDQIDQKADADFKAYVSLAHINMLKLDEGYEATPSQWQMDVNTPTRLGEMETTVRLARWDGTSLEAWYPHEKFQWDMSQVGIRSGLVDKEIVHSGALGEEIVRLKEQLPDKGKWSVLVPLIQVEDGQWRGEALNKQDEPMVVTYNRQRGVTVMRKEG